MQLAQRINTIMDETTTEGVWSRLLEQMEEYGFDRLLYATTRFRTVNSLGNLSDALILTNLPQSYMDVFLDDDLYKHAPAVQWSAQNTGCVSWSETLHALQAGQLSREQIKLLELNAAYGVRAGYTVSFREVSARAGGGVGLSSQTMTQSQVDALWINAGNEIEALVKLAHLRISDLPYVGHRNLLTDRQREVLELVADGKTAADIALLLGRTVVTVEKHLRNARDALGVETTAQAILKANTQNQFFLIDSEASLADTA